MACGLQVQSGMVFKYGIQVEPRNLFSEEEKPHQLSNVLIKCAYAVCPIATYPEKNFF